MVIQKSFKFRLYPKRKQEKKLESALGQACFLYNQLLDIHQQAYFGEGITLSQFNMNYLVKDFKLDRLGANSKQNISKRISDAFNHFFRRVKNGETPGFPKFKKRVFYDSITFPQYRQEISANNRLYVSKIGMIKIVKHREIEGNIKTLTIKKEGDEWYAVFSCDNVPVEENKQEFKSEVEGLDAGINKFLVCSDGREAKNPNFLRKQENKLKKFQRRLTKKKKKGKNRKKARLKLNGQHRKVRRQREDFHKKLAKKLASEIKYIGIEDLNIEGMMKNHYLAKSISDVGWGSFFSYLKYYKTIFGGDIIEVGRFEPTSKTCSSCEHKQDIPLSKRVFRCENCGLIEDRDLNASINIKKLAKQQINNTCGQWEIYAFGDTVRPLQVKASVVELGNYRGVAV